jgi:hypothetical protein
LSERIDSAERRGADHGHAVCLIEEADPSGWPSARAPNSRLNDARPRGGTPEVSDLHSDPGYQYDLSRGPCPAHKRDDNQDQGRGYENQEAKNHPKDAAGYQASDANSN